jgi:hypothetical protein
MRTRAEDGRTESEEKTRGASAAVVTGGSINVEEVGTSEDGCDESMT